MLIAHLSLHRNGYRKPKVLYGKASEFLESYIYEDLNEKYGEIIEEMHLTLDKASSILVHVEMMKQTTMLCAYLQALIHHLTLTLLFCLGRNIYQWNLPNLAWQVTVGVPTLNDRIKRGVAMMQYVACPRLSFPISSNFYNSASQSRGICNGIHHNVTFLQVSKKMQ